jgi:hypothetical protein
MVKKIITRPGAASLGKGQDAKRRKSLAVVDGFLASHSVPNTFKQMVQYPGHLGSGLIDQSQKMSVAAMQMADIKVWAHRS